MKHILLLVIKSYWFLIPPKNRNKCLFKKSCSHFVFEITKEDGLLKGLKALQYRFEHCRPGYYVINSEEGKLMISAHNKVFNVNEIKNEILKNENKNL